MITESSVLNTRYRLEKKIGQGGFAQVFLATDQLLKRRVAVKVLNSELTEDENFLGRFEREAQSIAALDHPNILGVYDYGQAEDTAYLVMPYVEGGTLHDKLRREKALNPRQAAFYLKQAAAALDYAHRRNIVHRDIKPQNMLLRLEDDHLFLGDFGIAKVLSSASAQSRTGVMGTLSYMAPEQLEGNVKVGTDVYALGCVLFQMLSGQLPYQGPTEQVMMGHIMKPVPSILERSQGLPPAVQGVIERALAKKVEDRFQTAGELSQAFEAVLNGDATLMAMPPRPPAVSPTDQTRVAGGYSGPPTTARPELAPPATYQGQTPPVYPYHYNQTGASTGTPPYGYTPPAGTPPQGFTMPGPGTPPGGYPPPAYSTGPIPPAKKSGNMALLGGLAAILLVAAAALAAILVVGGGKSTTPTAAIAINPTTAPAPTAAPTTGPATTQAAPSPVATTAAPTPVALDPVAQALKEARDTFFVKGDLQAGIARYRDLSLNYPGNAKVWRDYGNALHLWGRNAGGLEQLKKAVELDPKDALAYLYLTDALIDNRNYAEAEKAAREALKLDPAGWAGHAAMAAYYNTSFKYDLARAEADAMQRGAGNAASDPFFNWMMAIFQYYQEDYKGSLASIDKTLAVWPNVPLAIAVKADLLLYSPTDKANEKANQQQALGLIEQAEKLSPGSTLLLDRLATYYATFEKDFEQAEKYALQVLKIDENNPSSHYTLGLVKASKKDYPAAFKEYERCIQIDEYYLNCQSDWALSLIDQGFELADAGKSKEADAAFKLALEKSLKAYNYVPKNSFYNWLVGYSYYRLKDYKNAIEYMQKAVNSSPQADYYAWLGFAYFYNGQKDKAQAEYNKAVAIDPDNSSVKDLGETLKK